MYASQTSVAPPTFVLFTNSQAKLHFSYERFLENRLRETYGFFGNPIRIQVRGRHATCGPQERKTAAERAPDRRKPVKKGPGSKPTRGERSAREARRQAAARNGPSAVSARGQTRHRGSRDTPAGYTAQRGCTKTRALQGRGSLRSRAGSAVRVAVVGGGVPADRPGAGRRRPRLYRASDVELVLRIKQLVFEEGLTLSGARRRLEEDSGQNNGAAVLVEEVARRSRARPAATGEIRAASRSSSCCRRTAKSSQNCVWSPRRRRRRRRSRRRQRRKK